MGWTGVAFDHRIYTLITAVGWTLYTALWWLAMDIVVDDSGVRIAGGPFGQRVGWLEVEGFEVDPSTRKVVLVLAAGERKRLVYVPDSAAAGLQLRWQRATGREISTVEVTPDASS